MRCSRTLAFDSTDHNLRAAKVTATSSTQMPKAITIASILIAISTQSGCMVVGDIAYSDAMQRETSKCERLPSMSDRQLCMQRINDAGKQADAQRKK
jgi:hypothetical protein